MACVALIVAVSRNGVIGRDGDLPWHLPEDLQHFKRLTLGKPIIMGRLTWESIGRPLPGRTNIVISRTPDYEAPGAEVVPSFEAALAHASPLVDADGEIMIIGGAQIYRAALPLADRIYRTRVGVDVVGDTVFPELDSADWRVLESCQQTSPAAGLNYTLEVLVRS